MTFGRDIDRTPLPHDRSPVGADIPIAARMGIEIVNVYRDYGVSGAKGRDQRPQFDHLCRMRPNAGST
jgi:hypothetical protein